MTVKSMRHRLCNNAGGGGGGGGGALLYNLRAFSACRHKYVLGGALLYNLRAFSACRHKYVLGGALLYNLRAFSACRHKYVLDSYTCMFKDYKYVIETPFNAFANRADPRSDSSYKSCLNRVYSVCLWKYD